MKRPSLLNTLRLSFFAVVGSLLALYTLLLVLFFLRGLEAAAEVDLLFTAHTYEARLQQQPDLPLPQGLVLQCYWAYSDMPEQLQRLFPATHHRDRTVLLEYDEREAPGEADVAMAYVFMPYQLQDGRTLYLTKSYGPSPFLEILFERSDRLLELTLPLALGLLVLAALSAYALSQGLRRPVQSLAQWADALAQRPQAEQRPDFRFRELNQIGDRLLQLVGRLRRGVEREERFLRYASHELRTPIATVRANVDLLRKQTPALGDNASLQRIDRAAVGMQQLTEALLWLSREQELPTTEQVPLAALVAQAVAESRHQLHGKPVELQMQLPEKERPMAMPATLYRIACSNLIRNAFQHTAGGTIRIHLTGTRLEIVNHDTEDSPAANGTESFGIGLELVDIICHKLHWQLALAAHADGFTAILDVAGGSWGEPTGTG